MNHAIEEIEIFDEFLDEALRQRVLEDMQRPKWSFTGGFAHSRFWHMDGLEQEEFYRTTLFGLVCERLGRPLELVRCYANGQTACQSGMPHHDDGELTFLYYPGPELVTGMGGSLVFLDSDGKSIPEHAEILRAIAYKANRAVFFPASIAHHATAPDRHFGGVRVSVAWKMRRVG
ncbi:hypothetical protein [Paraliomyxa miuraensis]|uniref:hypothetical protein n=1 Tax=Paraliomyxa miuraensis TaxID=376150 RepID=UPI0022574BA3|nr:hypothetical protein [Paraliomyxa miuraensis]MCX4245229.1 hypothetical protein [Paraliomyxa miuraensis]